jgi:transposase-like protein
LKTVPMDSDKISAQVGRLEVVETSRRRRWSEDEKLKIVLDSLQAPRRVAAKRGDFGKRLPTKHRTERHQNMSA